MQYMARSNGFFHKHCLHAIKHIWFEVQRYYIIMAPTSRKDAPIRLAAVGKKQLPKTKGRFWACIQGLSQKVLLRCLLRHTHGCKSTICIHKSHRHGMIWDARHIHCMDI